MYRVDYGSWALPFHALPSSIYKPSFISMPTVVFKLFAGQGTRRTDKAATLCFPLPLLHKDKKHGKTIGSVEVMSPGQ